jgi:hypothetical protein
MDEYEYEVYNEDFKHARRIQEPHYRAVGRSV